MRITPAFFCFPFAWNIFFHPLTFTLYVSLGLKWVSCRQQIYGSCFYIHSVSLCLLVGAFNPFTLKVIIDMYVLIAIFLIVWDWFHRYLQSLCLPLGFTLDHYVVSFLVSCNLPYFKVFFCPIWGLLFHLSFASLLHGIYFSILWLLVYMCL